MKYIFVIFMLLFITGCQSTSATIDTVAEVLFTPKKNTKGEISKGIYTSPGKEFSIMVPHWSDKGTYNQMTVKEQFDETGQYLSFAYPRFRQGIYRVQVARKLSPENKKIDLESVKEKIFSNYIEQLENAYQVKAVLLSEKQNLFESKKSISRIYKLGIPESKKSGKSYRLDFDAVDLADPVTSHRYHAIDIVDYGTYSALFWVELPAEKNAEDNGQLEKTLIDGTNENHISFVKTFKILSLQ